MPGTDNKKASRADGTYWFFLGGHDLEMITIRDLLDTHYESRYSDAGLKWGAKASSYETEIREKIDQGYIPVLVELEVDIEHSDDSIEVIDHHGADAGQDQPTSLEQVYALLGIPFASAPEEHRAIAANDRGHARELRQNGFSAQLIRAVREKEWTLTGIKRHEIDQAEQAIRSRLICSNGVCTVQAPHDRASLIADLLLKEFSYRFDPGSIPEEATEPEVLLIEGPNEWNVFAPGRVIKRLVQKYPSEGAWSGGSLPEYGFWGAYKESLDATRQDLLRLIREH